MFKDYDKYLTASLKVYLFVLICIFILKLSGLDYFGIDINSPIIVFTDNIANRLFLTDIYYMITLYFYTLFLTSITFERNDKRIKIITLVYTFFGIILKYIEMLIANTLINCILDFIYLFIMFYITNKKEKKPNVSKRVIVLFCLNTFYQFITIIIRNINYVQDNSFTINLILSIDYLLMLIITYKLYFMKGEFILCGTEVGSFSLKKVNLKKSLKKLQKNWRNFKKLDKVTKLTNIIYFTLSLFWNLFNVALVLFVAMLNDTFIECIFILTSFWLTKGKFGKAFHFQSMGKCFIVSNLSYYVLNRLTTPLGISIIIPIMLGVGLSYVTSKFVKKTYKPLYRGMSPELFEETILQVTDKDSHKYKICYDFYINKKSIIALSMKYNYTEAGIRKIKDRINKQIKGLN